MLTQDVENVKFRMPREVYICTAIEFLTTFGSAITSIPSTRLIESAVCQRHYGTDKQIAEHICKDSRVQTDMAQLLGAMASFSALPGLLLTIPYGVVAEHVDRRFILLANSMSNVGAMLYMVAICSSKLLDLRLLWLSAVFEVFGGGGTVFMMLVRTIIAEAIPSSHLSKLLYQLSAINLLIRLLGVAFGSWLSRNGPASAMLIGISLFSIIIPVLTYLPNIRSHNLPVSADSHELSYIRLDQDPTSRPSETAAGTAKHMCGKDILASLNSLFNLIFHNTTFKTCLAIMFLNTIALDARSLVRPWLSKRYDWTLEFTGYMLSLESILGVVMFFILQYVDSVSAVTKDETLQKRKSELVTSKLSLACAIFGSILLGFATRPWIFFTSTIVIAGSAGFVDTLRAFFTSRIGKEDIGKLYSAVMVLDTLATILSSPIWSTVYGLGYALGGIWEGLPFWLSAGVMLGVAILVWRLRAS